MTLRCVRWHSLARASPATGRSRACQNVGFLRIVHSLANVATGVVRHLAFWPPPTSRRWSPGLETSTPNKNAHWPPLASCRWCPCLAAAIGSCLSPWSLLTVRLQLPNPRSTGVKPAGPCWQAVGSLLVVKPPVPRHEAGGAAQFPKPDSSATPSEQSAELKSSHENNTLNVC